MKVRLSGLPAECQVVAEKLRDVEDLVVAEESPPYANRGGSELVRVYLEVRLAPPRR